MANPYQGRPDHTFWKRSVSALDEADVDPVVGAPFRVGRNDLVATAGSCFAQHISRSLTGLGYRYLITETAPGDGEDEGYGVFPARFGNIYTARQLLQTFERAYGLFRPADSAWARNDGVFVDPFRPRIRADGFPSPAAVEADRKRHLAAVRTMFETCDVFIFTLGLTEAWVSALDGAVFPVAPGVSGGEASADYAFHNMTVDEVAADLRAFLARLRVVNPEARVVLTVSPVPLVATYEDRHVLVSTTYSKSVLRVAADAVAASEPGVAYFPAYEIVTGPQARGRYFAPDLRTVTEAGVARVMDLFARHMLSDAPEEPAPRPAGAPAPSAADNRRFDEIAEIVCDEEALDPG